MLKRPNIKYPFFAYGIFKPGQIAFSRIKHCVNMISNANAHHRMYIRDGIPFISRDSSEFASTNGFLMEFKNEKYTIEAYDIICEVVSEKLYYWKEIMVNDKPANALIGRKPSRSHPEHHGSNFDGSNDPYFNEVIDLIYEDLNEKLDYWNVKDYFKLQRNYILLWAAIERYTSLKYGKNSKTDNNEKLANESIFHESLDEHVNEKRDIFRTDNLLKHSLDVNDPEDSIKYYYTIRCNIVHRGKSLYSDGEIVFKSLTELLNIFKDILDDTFIN